MILDNPADASNPTSEVAAAHYTFITVVYWKKLPEMMPGLFHNPLEADAQAFAEVHVFIPRKRLELVRPEQQTSSRTSLGGVPGEIAYVGSSGGSQSSSSNGTSQWEVGRVGGPSIWNLWNQSWDCQLAPVTAPPWPRSCKPIRNCPVSTRKTTRCRTSAG